MNSCGWQLRASTVFEMRTPSKLLCARQYATPSLPVLLCVLHNHGWWELLLGCWYFSSSRMQVAVIGSPKVLESTG